MGLSNRPPRLTGTLRLTFTVLMLLFVCSPLAAQTELIGNGSFASGSTGWTRSGNFFADSRFSNCHTCPGYSYLSNSDGSAGNNLVGTMYQTVNVPSNSNTATISFWYYITTQEMGAIAFDVLNVTIQNSSGGFLSTVAVLSNVNAGTGYAQKSVNLDLTPYRGQTIRIHFVGTTDSTLPSTFRVDDVSISANVNPGAPVIRIEPTSLNFNEPANISHNIESSSSGSAEAQAKLQRANSSDEPITGQRDIASETSVVNFADLARQDALKQPAPQESPRFVPEPEEEEKRERPVPPDATVFRQESLSPVTIQPLGPSPVTSSSFLGVSATGWIPPDTQGAAGPNHLMVAVNGGLLIQNKSGNNIGSVRALSTFFGSATNGSNDVFDPRLQYDPIGNRWIVIAVADRRSAASAVLVAVSQTNDPTGNWNLNRIDADPADQSWADYPTLGFNKDWIVVSTNMFANPGSSAQFYPRFYVLNKSSFYAGGTNYTRISGPTNVGGTITPASTFDPNLSTLYLLQNWNGNSGGSGYLRLYSITGAVGAEVLNNTTSGIFISTSNPWDSGVGTNFAPQLGTSVKIEVNDAGIQNLLYRNGSLWCAHSIFLPSGNPTRSSVQWWQINPTSVSVQQRGRIDDASGNRFYGFPSIAVNSDSDVLIGYSRFSADQYASAGYAYRAGNDPANSLRDDTALKAGASTYNKLDDNGRNRWGDYSGTSVDPSNNKDFWTLQEYTASTNTWGTWWGRISPPNTPPSVFKVFTVYNDGTSTLTVNSISKQNNSSWLSIDPSTSPPLTIAPGQFANVAVVVNTGGLSSGSYSDRLLVNSNDSARSPYPNAVFVNLNVGGGGECSSTSISVGQTRNGSLSSSDCVVSGTGRRYDVYSFSGVAGQGVAASMDSTAFDTYLYLTNSANQILDEDNNSGPGNNSRIPNASGFFTLPANGSYRLWASSSPDGATGSYTVTLTGCTYSISSSENTVGPGNGGGSFQMDTSSGCEWTASSDATSWLTTSSSGSGDGSVSYSFTANPSTSSRTGRITVGGQVSTITQIGIGGAGHVQFSSAAYSVNEGGGEATITVTRAGGTASGTVNYSTSNGTAVAGTDYTPASSVLIFSENVMSRTFTVPILEDTASEGNETINLTLSTHSTSLTLGSPSTATLTITDNEGPPPSPTPTPTPPPGATNFALASNGGVASASSTTPPDGTGIFFPSVTIDGDRKGLNTSFWRDGTGDSYPDWLQVDFAGSKAINEIDVYTVQDNYTNPAEPSAGMTFNLYGITGYEVQTWNGSSWVTVPGGSVVGNNNVWRKFTFSQITTSKIRVLVNNALASRSRVVELEAYSSSAPPPNFALASNGGVASASSTTSPDGTGIFFPSVTIDGDRKGLNTSFWRDGTGDSYPDWLQVDFAGSKTINEIDVYTVQDNYTNPAEPSAGMTFNLYGITGYEVQTWNGSSWVTVPGGSVVGNNNVWRRFTFAAITTSKIRVLVNNALASRSRVVELEAYNATAPPPNVASAANGGVASASSTTPPDGTGIFFPSVTIDGDRKGLNTSFWRDGTGDSYPDWLQVDFAGSKTINEIDVYTVQDNYTNPAEPTAGMTFNLYGITGYEVQTWNGSSWVTVPGGSVVGNNNVWRKFTFSQITTSKIRVLVNNALVSRSRIVELEAYNGTAPPPNVASAANGGVASASSTTPPDGTGIFFPSVTIDGDRKGLNTSFWRDGTGDSYPDWLQVDFAGSKTINEIDVYTVQDNYTNPAEPSAGMTFNLYGITGYEVQTWNGSSWVTVPGGSVVGNNNVWRKFTFSQITTGKIRVLVNNALASRSRIVELEAYNVLGP